MRFFLGCPDRSLPFADMTCADCGGPVTDRRKPGRGGSPPRRCRSCQQRRHSRSAAVQASRRRHLLRVKYGITPEQYDAMMVAQGGVCAVCRQPETTIIRGTLAMLAVDHDHRTGAIRALLCRRCNGVLGQACDGADLLRAMAAYLDEHRMIPA